MPRLPMTRRRIATTATIALLVGALAAMTPAWVVQTKTLRGSIGLVESQSTRLVHANTLMYRAWRLDGQWRYSIGSTQWELLMDGWSPDVADPAPVWLDPADQPSGRAADFPSWGPTAPLERPDVFRQATAFGVRVPMMAHGTVERVVTDPDGARRIDVRTPWLVRFDAMGRPWALALRPVWSWFLPATGLVGALAFPILNVGWFLARRRRARVGLCPGCGYDLVATATRCPECGRETAPTSARAKPTPG